MLMTLKVITGGRGEIMKGGRKCRNSKRRRRKMRKKTIQGEIKGEERGERIVEREVTIPWRGEREREVRDEYRKSVA